MGCSLDSSCHTNFLPAYREPVFWRDLFLHSNHGYLWILQPIFLPTSFVGFALVYSIYSAKREKALSTWSTSSQPCWLWRYRSTARNTFSRRRARDARRAWRSPLKHPSLRFPKADFVSTTLSLSGPTRLYGAQPPKRSAPMVL